LFALGLAEAGEQLVRVGEVLGSACFKQLTCGVRKRYECAAAVVWVGPALGEPALDEAVDA
jgi:hypothetical protein